MNKRAFTLIEVMIVVAIISIFLTFQHIGIRGFKSNIDKKNIRLKRNTELASFYLHMKKNLKKCNKIDYADEYNVKFDGDFFLRSICNGSTVDCGDKLFELGSLVKIWGYEKVDENTFSMQLQNGLENIRVFWRIGNE